MIYNKTGRVFTNALDEIFNSSFNDLVGAHVVNKTPAVNIFESDDMYTISLAAPGLTKEHFDISIKDMKLTIVGNTEEANRDESLVKEEFNYGNFERSFSLSDDVDTTDVDASYVDGILRLDIKKIVVPAEDKVKTIEIG